MITAYAHLKYFCKPLIFFPKLLKEGLKLSGLLLYFGVVIIYYDHYRFFKNYYFIYCIYLIRNDHKVSFGTANRG